MDVGIWRPNTNSYPNTNPNPTSYLQLNKSPSHELLSIPSLTDCTNLIPTKHLAQPPRAGAIESVRRPGPPNPPPPTLNLTQYTHNPTEYTHNPAKTAYHPP
ncbi:hypothetical protein Salat_0147600 [Sesamum alatum]|uniref:Uncharacterized protein n=1 Tax=Sesamum alatum TaxID=300844 RepID=A0AAE1YWL7_9LAMI|nr:hypothetical protein Salat_0147600 [Sesamum alatum]